jgi:hypothetical protein
MLAQANWEVRIVGWGCLTPDWPTAPGRFPESLGRVETPVLSRRERLYAAVCFHNQEVRLGSHPTPTPVRVVNGRRRR